MTEREEDMNSKPWILEEGERIEFHYRGERRGGGFAYHGEPYFTYGDIWVVGPDGDTRRVLGTDVYEGFLKLYMELSYPQGQNNPAMPVFFVKPNPKVEQ